MKSIFLTISLLVAGLAVKGQVNTEPATIISPALSAKEFKAAASATKAAATTGTTSTVSASHNVSRRAPEVPYEWIQAGFPLTGDMGTPEKTLENQRNTAATWMSKNPSLVNKYAVARDYYSVQQDK